MWKMTNFGQKSMDQNGCDHRTVKSNNRHHLQPITNHHTKFGEDPIWIATCSVKSVICLHRQTQTSVLVGILTSGQALRKAEMIFFSWNGRLNLTYLHSKGVKNARKHNYYKFSSEINGPWRQWWRHHMGFPPDPITSFISSLVEIQLELWLLQ